MGRDVRLCRGAPSIRPLSTRWHNTTATSSSSRSKSLRAIEDATDGAGDFGSLIQTRDVSLGVLLEVELAALPGDGAKDGLARRGHAGVIVADQQRLSEGDELRDGGAAMTAYARMQFEEMAERERQEIRAALLRYCELDTLAMVVIYEAWRDLIEQTKAK